MKLQPFFLAFLMILISCPLFSQKPVKVKGTAKVRQEVNMTKEETKSKAEEQAKINALGDKFGTYIEQNFDYRSENGVDSYNMIGGTKTKGVWIKTEDRDFKEDIQVDTKTKETTVWITCNIEGTARAVSPQAPFQAITSRCPELKCRTVDFNVNESLYLYFRSSTSGYLSVWNEEGEQTVRLFPYDNAGDQSAILMKGEQDYVLFDSKSKSGMAADPIVLIISGNQNIEYNLLHVVFSPTQYKKPLMRSSQKTPDGTILPRSIPTGKFQEWLGENRAMDEEFQDKVIKFSISKL